MNKKRPVGSLIFAILELIFSGGMLLFYGIIIMFGVAYIGSFNLESLSEFQTSFYIGIFVLTICLSILLFVSAIGIIRSKNWGRKGIILGSIISIIVSVLSLGNSFFNISNIGLNGGTSLLLGTSLGLMIIPLAYRGIVIWYFNKKNVKEYFQTNQK